MTINVCALSSSSSEQRTNSQEEQCVTADVSSPARSVSNPENEDVPFITPLPVRTLRMVEESPPEKLASSLTDEMMQPPITDVTPPIRGSTRTSRQGAMRACGGVRGKHKAKGCLRFDTHDEICVEADPPVLGRKSHLRRVRMRGGYSSPRSTRSTLKVHKTQAQLKEDF